MDPHEQLHKWLDENALAHRFMPGWADFVVIRGERVALVKLGNARFLLQEQSAALDGLKQQGTPVLVTDSVADAIAFLREKLLS